MRYLTIEEVLVLHAYQIDRFGGQDGVRDAGLLESAVIRPQASFSGKDLYKTVYDKAAVLAAGIILNHPFIDGNKRTGIHAMLVFLELNGIRLEISDIDLVKIANRISKKEITIIKLSEFVKRHC